jgi:hypothetical protein
MTDLSQETPEGGDDEASLPSPSVHDVDIEISVRVTINDPDVVRRCVENLDDQGVPQPDERGSRGWRNVMYDLRTEEDVINHLAWNCAMNHFHDASRLDGWADLPPTAATMTITDSRTL